MGRTARFGADAMEIPVEYYGLIEGGVSLFAVLAFAGWQLWSLREKPGDKPDAGDDDAPKGH
ncbi:hypothetical protein CAP39_03080 [Sphingomonas sp. IBVSS1]|nr:hypothetical protein CAP39_03080 [Sphingomonas sp. IBVSS1]